MTTENNDKEPKIQIACDEMSTYGLDNTIINFDEMEKYLKTQWKDYTKRCQENNQKPDHQAFYEAYLEVLKPYYYMEVHNRIKWIGFNPNMPDEKGINENKVEPPKMTLTEYHDCLPLLEEIKQFKNAYPNHRLSVSPLPFEGFNLHKWLRDMVAEIHIAQSELNKEKQQNNDWRK